MVILLDLRFSTQVRHWRISVEPNVLELVLCHQSLSSLKARRRRRFSPAAVANAVRNAHAKVAISTLSRRIESEVRAISLVCSTFDDVNLQAAAVKARVGLPISWKDKPK